MMKMSLEFLQRSTRDRQELSEIVAVMAAVSFGDVSRDGYGGASKLAR
jgi:hypothetical protein